jgi:hypothetical protein
MKEMSLDPIKERISAHHHTARKLSLKLLAWEALLERQSECEGFSELEGLGISLRDYGRRLERMAHSLDLLQIRLEQIRETDLRRGSKISM